MTISDFWWIFFVVILILALIIIYNFVAAAMAIKYGKAKKPATESANKAVEGDTAEEPAVHSEEEATDDGNYYYNNGDDYYNSTGEDAPIDEEGEMPYQFSDSLTTTGSMEAFVYAELRKRELEVDGDRKKRELELDADRKKRELELDAEKKHREMELELEKKRLEIDREVKLRKIEADREIARVQAMSNMFAPLYSGQQPVQQQQQQQGDGNNGYADWQKEKEADRLRDEKFAEEQRREAAERARKEEALNAERRKIEQDLREKEIELENRTKEAEEAKHKAEQAAEMAQQAAANAAAAAAKGGGGLANDDALEVNVITTDVINKLDFETVAGVEDKIPAAKTLDYTVEDVYNYAAAKDGVFVKDAAGKKPTTFRSGPEAGAKSFLLIYKLDDYFKLTFKCGPSYAGKMKEVYPEIEKSKFPYGLFWFALEPADKVGFEVIKTLIDISSEISKQGY